MFPSPVLAVMDTAGRGFPVSPYASATAHCLLSRLWIDTSFRMSLTTFSAAAAQVRQHVEAQARRLARRRRAFREGLADAAALNDAQAGLYRMDVGGAPFHTQTDVVQRHQGMLSAMASDDFGHDVEEDGYTFLDRDPTWFPLVLHFLRTGAALLPDNAKGRATVFREAQYYSLEGLCWEARPLQERLFVKGSNRQTDPDLPPDCCTCALRPIAEVLGPLGLGPGCRRLPVAGELSFVCR